MTPERWHEIESVFQAAADRQDAERAKFLDQVCRGDEELRRQVESLLSAGGGLAEAVEDSLRTRIEAIAAEHSRALIGERIGPYRLLELIGRGGMGAVYRAARDDDFRKIVAIKLMHHGMDSDLFAGCFRRERQILAMLEHPYVARLHDGGTAAGGRPYLVMEYVAGQPVTQYCDNRRLGVRERVVLFLRVCEAVSHAHRNLVVHRDIKPENILVTEDGTPKLLDFGVAKLLDPSLTSGQTGTFARMLTPYYASPEQIRGEPPTTAMDVYSLGAVLYHVLTGTCAHQGSGASLAALEHAICHREPDRPRRLNRSVSHDLEKVVLMALRGDPARRYRSVEQFSDDLIRYLSDRPVSARQDSVWYRAVKFARRNALAAGATAAVAASLLVGTALSTLQAQRAQRRFEHVRRLANVMLIDLNDRVRVLPGSLQVRELLVKTGLEYLDGLGQDSGRSGDLTFDLARGYERIGALQASPDPAERTLGRRSEALGSYRRALSLARTLERERPDSPELQLLLARIHIGIGGSTPDSLERERSFDEGLRLLGNLKGAFPDRRWEPDGPPLVDYLGQVVRFARSAPLLSGGDFQSAMKLAAEAGPDLGPHIIVPALHATGDLELALNQAYAFRKSREVVLARVSDDILTHINRVSYARASSWIGRILGDGFAPNLGDPGRARRELARGMAVVRLAIARDPQDPSARRVLRLCELAVADSLTSSDPALAASIYERSIAESTSANELRRGPPFEDALWKITYPLLRTGRYKEALTRALHSARLTRSPRAELALAEVLAAGNAAGAKQQFQVAVRSAAAHMADRPQDMHARNDLGVAYETYGSFLLSQGDCAAARHNFAEAVAVWREWTRYGVAGAYNRRREIQAAALLKGAAVRPCTAGGPVKPGG